jgi:nucleoside-diphosphate-sugar epimerase
LASKQAAELLVESYGEILLGVVVRLYFVYGPGQETTMLLPRLVGAVDAGEPVFLGSPDGFRSNPVHVRDSVAALVQAARLEKGVTVDVAGPDVASIRELATMIGKCLGSEPVFEHGPGRREDLIGDTTAMERWLGRATTGLADGIGGLCEWWSRTRSTR